MSNWYRGRQDDRLSSTSQQSRLQLRSRIGAAIAVCASALVLWVCAISFQVAMPPQPAPRQADLIVSLAPGYDRLPTALAIFEEGVGDRLAVSWFPSDISPEEPGYEQVRVETETCTGLEDARVTCFTPASDDTLGEALASRALVDQYEAKSVLVVTSRYHAFRAQLIFERCLPDGVSVEVVPAPTELSLAGWMHHLVYENAAVVKALITTSSNC